jgi:HSP20 family protein
MANISLYDPFGNRFNRLVSNLFANPMLFDEKEGLELKVDLAEDEKSYLVRADIPGVKKDDIKVDIHGNHVSISAEMTRAKEEKKGENVVYSERYEGKVFRSFTLDREVDESAAQAKYDDGVLELTLPKKMSGGSRRLAVS